MILSSHATLVDLLFKQVGITKPLSRPTVHVRRLVKALAEGPGEYVMSAVHVGIEGFGNALYSGAFYGEDVGEALLFRELLPRLKPRRVALSDVVRRAQVLSVNYKGDLSFTYNGPASLRDVDGALRFLSKNRYLDWRESPPDAHVDEWEPSGEGGHDGD